MTERKTGPVKPPVIDLKARETQAGTATAAAAASETSTAAPADAGKAAAASAPPQADAPKPDTPKSDTSKSDTSKPDAAKSDTSKTDTAKPAPPPPRPPARLAMPWSAISIAAIGGALLGAGLTYLLASWMPLPSGSPAIADPAPQLQALSGQLATLEQRQATLEERAADTQISLDATIQQLDSGLADTGSAVAALEAAMPTALDTELDAIETQLQTLASQVSATAAGASSTDAAALAESLTGLEADLATLGSRVDAAIDRLDDRINDLRLENSGTPNNEIAQTVKLPLIVSGLDAAFATGRPYATELQSLAAILPDLEVPEPVTASAESGFTRPELLIARFEERLPDILASRTATSSGDWTQDALDWTKALLALRPAGEIEGDSPEAIVSRLEAAMERRDFRAAATYLAELPEPMRLAAGELAPAIQLQALADSFIADLRAQALAPAAEATR